MYTKSIITSALLATCVAATNHEMPPPAPAAHVMTTAAHPAPAPAATVHKAMPPPAAPAVHPPAAPPMAPPVHEMKPPMDAWVDNNKGGMAGHEQLTVHLVAVGDNNGSLKYFPDTVHAMPGEVVQFQFHPKNHTVTESSFDAPCKAKDASLSTPERPGLRSGFIPVTGNEDTTPVYNVLVNDTMPIWIFCGQGPHCQRGMSMVINPPANNPERTIQKYQEAAAALPVPDAPPAGGAPPPASPPAGAPSGGAASPPSPPPAPASPPSPPAGGAGPAETPETPAAAGAQSSTDSAPATFTGAATKTSSFGLGALFLGVVALL